MLPYRRSSGRPSISETRAIRETVDGIICSVRLQSTIADLVRRANRPDAREFERYAGLVLRAAGGMRFSEIAPAAQFQILPPGDGKMARIVTASKLSSEEAAVVSCIEDAINRLASIADAVEDGFVAGGNSHDEVRIGYSLFGSAFLPTIPGYRSARIALPSIDSHVANRLPYYNEIDWRALDHIASTSHLVFQHSVVPNVHQSVLGAFAPNGSDWDVRTRLASFLENLEFPLSFRYRYDCNVDSNTAAVVFNLPDKSSLPAYRLGKDGQNLVPTGDDADSAVLSCAIRIACLVAAACFGSGRVIEHAVAIAENTQGEPVLCCRFNRDTYVFETLPAVDSEKISSPAYRFDPMALRDLVGNEILLPSDSSMRKAEIVDGCKAEFAMIRRNPSEDQRPLSPELKRLFRAQSIADIDCMHYYGSLGAEIDEAKLDASESIIAAIARLEHIVDELEKKLADRERETNSRAIYCSNPYARLVITLADDMTSVAYRAESYIHGDLAGSLDDADLPFFTRAPHALYHAHMGLSDLYERIGDLKGAESEADRCIALAPTTVDAHFRKSYLLGQQGKFVEAANLILSVLPYAVTDDDCSTLYYHLGLLLWNLERKNDAAAVYAYTASRHGAYSEKAKKILQGLRKKGAEYVIAHASPLAAAREMKRSRIPIAPNDTTMSLIAAAVLGLSTLNAPVAAAPYTPLLVRYFRNDRVIAVACNSICHGLDRTE